ncbi:MAG: hypothetical protein JW996_04015 [Candidatus Cloacimonetes bacterium]|nr:hypothetical protein [Candidatus Cloacimonadota bacterium]
MWHDQQYLYLDARVELTDAFNPSVFTSRDQWPNADYLRLQLITDLKNYYSYCYYFFPLGNLYDAVRSSDLSLDKNWNSTYNYRSQISEDFWEISAKIPFSDLRINGVAPYHWKMIITCYEKNTANSYSIPCVNSSMGKNYFREALDLTITETVTQSRNFYLRPYLLGMYDNIERELQLDQDNLGIDFSLKPDYSSNFKFSYNPDFSDVPPDDEIDIYYSRYAPTYPENRYFFVEDFNVFGLDYDSFYTRHISNPHYGVKFTSSKPTYNCGILMVKDRSDKGGSGDYYNLITYRPVSEYYRMNFAFFNRMNKHYHNDIISFAPAFEFIKNNTIWADLQHSWLKNDSVSNNGFFVQTGYSYRAADFCLAAQFEQMSKNFARDMGNIYEDDYYGWHLESWQKYKTNKGILRDWSWELWVSEELDNRSNALLERIFQFSIEQNFLKNITVKADFKYVREFYKTSYYNKYSQSLLLGCEFFCWLNTEMRVTRLRNLIRQEQKTESGWSHYLGLSGNLGQHFSYSISAENIDYPELDQLPQLDPDYQLLNCDVSVSLSNNFTINGGWRYDNYEYYDYSVYDGYYLNIGCKPTLYWDIYLGFKYSANQIKDSFSRNYEYFYLKVSYKI